MRRTQPNEEVKTSADAIRIVIDLLSRRDHCRFELQQKLRQRGVEAQEIETALAHCEAEGWLNESAYAASFIRGRAGKGHGPRRILQELQMRQVASEISQEALEQYERENAVDWFEAAKALYQRRFGEHATFDYKERQKRQRYLFQRGYDSEQIQYAMSE